MSTDPLDQIEYHLSQAMHLLHQCRSGGTEPLPPALATHVSKKPMGNNKSLREWVAWLKRNQPAYRQVIWDETNINLTAHKSMVLDWTTDMVHWSDGQMPDDQLCRMRGPATGPGAPPSIYFLWSQRFDVHALHGVGPVGRPETEPILGVVHPPAPMSEMSEPRSDVTDGTVESPHTRFLTLDDWHAAWDPLLESLAPYDAKPSDDEMTRMVATMPAAVTDDPKAIIAVSYSAARRKAPSSED